MKHILTGVPWCATMHVLLHNMGKQMHILLDKFYTVTQDGENNVIVTRPSLIGKVNTHTITSPYDAFDIARWLYSRMRRTPVGKCPPPLVQRAFPLMSAEDREFLISGITPDQWKEIIKREEEEQE